MLVTVLERLGGGLAHAQKCVYCHSWGFLVLSELSYDQIEDRSPSQATVTVTNLRLTVSVDIKETGVCNIPDRTEPNQPSVRAVHDNVDSSYFVWNNRNTTNSQDTQRGTWSPTQATPSRSDDLA